MADLISNGVGCVYLDDFLMCSTDFPKHLQLLGTLFTRLRYAGLHYRLSKSAFCKKEVLYFGHIISAEGMAVAPHNTQKIRDFLSPKNVQGVRQLLGLFGYYRTFIKGYSNIAQPIIALMSKDCTICLVRGLCPGSPDIEGPDCVSTDSDICGLQEGIYPDDRCLSYRGRSHSESVRG